MPVPLQSGVLRKAQGRKPTLKMYCTGGINWTQTGNGKKETMKQDAPLFRWNGAHTNYTFPTALPMT